MHVVPAHRTASPIALKLWQHFKLMLWCEIAHSFFHLITSTPTSVIPNFIVSWPLLLYAVSRLVLTSEGGIDQAEVRVIRFPLGVDSVSASVDAPCAVIRGVPWIFGPPMPFK